jgi:hypothetical protein
MGALYFARAAANGLSNQATKLENPAALFLC